MATDNFIGGSCPARSGRTDDVVNPATGEVIAEVASSDAADVDAAVDAADGGLRDLGPHHAPGALREAAGARRRHRGQPRRAHSASRSRNVGKPVSIIEFEFDLTVDNLRFFAGAARTPAGPGRR